MPRWSLVSRTSRGTPAGRAAGPSLDWLLVLVIPGGSGPSSVVLLARGAGGYADTLTAGIEPLLRLTGQTGHLGA